MPFAKVVRRAAAAAALFASTLVHAASLQISPVTVDMPADARAAGITLSNPGDQPIYGQVRVFRWGQSDTEDTLEPTQDMVASPPLIQVAPHGEQLVRIVRQAQDAVTSEQSFRVLVDEIPRPENATADGVTIRLRYSVPVFIHPPGPVGKPALSWQLLRGPQGWLLRASNAGSRHGQVSEVKLDAGGRTFVLGKGLLGYVLAGHTQQWKVDLDVNADVRGPLLLHVTVNGQPGDASVTVAGPR